MRAYIKRLQSKEEDKRKQIFVGMMIGAMSIVILIWVYSLGVRFGSPKVKAQVNEDIKPFKLFSNSLSGAVKDIGASVGSVSQVDKQASQEVSTNKDEKQIDLIPIEYTN